MKIIYVFTSTKISEDRILAIGGRVLNFTLYLKIFRINIIITYFNGMMDFIERYR